MCAHNTQGLHTQGNLMLATKQHAEKTIQFLATSNHFLPVVPDDSSSSEEELEIPPAKKPCVSKTTSLPSNSKQSKCRSTKASSNRKCQNKWEKESTWLEYNADIDGAFCKICRTSERSLERTGGVWTTTPFRNWKKAVEKMKAHSQTNTHIKAYQGTLSTQHSGSVVQQLQNVAEQDRRINQVAVKSFFRCAHFLARHRIPNTTNFDGLVDLVVSCGGEHLRNFLDQTGRNAVYTSHVAVVEFMESLGRWVEESILKRLNKAQYFSFMADECTDIATIDEMAVFVVGKMVYQ
uniref:TTF-type domain-containing protein n=1 Tax=Amphimedon queenslandica TaxID=400682 RepID=A0A1X7VEY2_AMPQE